MRRKVKIWLKNLKFCDKQKTKQQFAKQQGQRWNFEEKVSIHWLKGNMIKCLKAEKQLWDKKPKFVMKSQNWVKELKQSQNCEIKS